MPSADIDMVLSHTDPVALAEVLDRIVPVVGVENESVIATVSIVESSLHRPTCRRFHDR